MRHYRRYLAGGLAALALCAMGTASASVGKVTQELEYRNIKVTLDGKELDLRNAKGDPVEPFMFGGTNYLPVRALSEALGLEVSWDSATATVVLSTPEAGDTVEWLADSGTLGDSEVAIRGAKMVWDDDGNAAMVITYGWTNHSQYRTYSFSMVNERAYQSGIKLPYAYLDDVKIYDPETSVREVRPGVTVEVQAAYVLADPDQTVEFELTENLGYTDGDRVVFRDFQPSELEWANTPPADEQNPVI